MKTKEEFLELLEQKLKDYPELVNWMYDDMTIKSDNKSPTICRDDSPILFANYPWDNELVYLYKYYQIELGTDDEMNHTIDNMIIEKLNSMK
jgi:hypothetical protein